MLSNPRDGKGSISIITESSVAQLLEVSGHEASARAGAAAANILALRHLFWRRVPCAVHSCFWYQLPTREGSCQRQERNPILVLTINSSSWKYTREQSCLACQFERMFTNLTSSWILSKPVFRRGWERRVIPWVTLSITCLLFWNTFVPGKACAICRGLK